MRSRTYLEYKRAVAEDDVRRAPFRAVHVCLSVRDGSRSQEQSLSQGLASRRSVRSQSRAMGHMAVSLHESQCSLRDGFPGRGLGGLHTPLATRQPPPVSVQSPRLRWHHPCLLSLPPSPSLFQRSSFPPPCTPAEPSNLRARPQHSHTHASNVKVNFSFPKPNAKALLKYIYMGYELVEHVHSGVHTTTGHQGAAGARVVEGHQDQYTCERGGDGMRYNWEERL